MLSKTKSADDYNSKILEIIFDLMILGTLLMIAGSEMHPEELRNKDIIPIKHNE